MCATVTCSFSDAVSRIRNAYMRGSDSVSVIKSKLNLNFVKVLLENGYVSSYDTSDSELTIELKYFENRSCIQSIKLLSKPGCRLYCKSKAIPKPYNGLGICVISTPRGVCSSKQAKEWGVGGMLLCIVY